MGEMQDKALHNHHVNIPKERKLSICFFFILMAFVGVLTLIYLHCLYTLNYDIQDSSMVVLETMGILSTLIMGMCLFRWCSFNRDISSESIWNRVAVRSGTPLKLLKKILIHINLILMVLFTFILKVKMNIYWIDGNMNLVNTIIKLMLYLQNAMDFIMYFSNILDIKLTLK